MTGGLAGGIKCGGAVDVFLDRDGEGGRIGSRHKFSGFGAAGHDFFLATGVGGDDAKPAAEVFEDFVGRGEIPIWAMRDFEGEAEVKLGADPGKFGVGNGIVDLEVVAGFAKVVSNQF